MNLLFANPLTQAFQYLLMLFYGTSLDSLHAEFSAADQKTNANSQQVFADASKHSNRHQDVYDFIVVGGGSAGSVVANRLSEENFTVLLIEAGGNPFPLTHVPSMALNMLRNPNIDWMDHVVPQKRACHALNNNGTMFNHGKALGGSSNLNYMIFMRGSPNDFNNWAHETDDPGWNYENVLPYFKKTENYNGNYPDDRYHGKDGPLHVGPNLYDPMQDEWLKAGEELGYPIEDPNGYQIESFFLFDTTTKQGTRFSTHRAYIYPVLDRPNLTIRIYSHVTKIHLDSRNRAVGVNYIQNGRQHFATAKKEIILSAGAICSPQILMLSGIGPEEDLKALGIPVKLNLPVGKNLQDHVMSFVGPFVVDDGKSFNPMRDINPTTLHEYIQNGTGPFSSLAVTGGAVLSSSKGNSTWPDLYISFLSVAMSEVASAALQNAHGFRPGVLQKYFKPDYGRDAFFLVVCLGLAETRGEIKLKSTNPFDKVIIDPMYFTHPDDLDIMMEGVKFVLKVGNDTETFKKIGARITNSIFPGCEEFGDAHNEEYWKCYIRHWTHTMWHFTCTCRMGKGEGDPNAVVDSSLRVIGTPNLRVIDGSIMPKVSNANTNIPIIMIGEKGADMIKKFWKDNPM